MDLPALVGTGLASELSDLILDFAVCFPPAVLGLLRSCRFCAFGSEFLRESKMSLWWFRSGEVGLSFFGSC